MRINIFTFCDFAAQYGEKLCITGASHSIYVIALPARVSGTIVGKILMERGDEGDHLFDVTLSDADGRMVCKCPRRLIKAREFADLPQNYEVHSHCMIHRVQFLLEKYGEYVIEMRHNDCALVATTLLVGRQPHP
jgi:hypothetical protein